MILYTDGACSGNPGPGGWAVILKHPATGYVKKLSGAERDTTNNRMELTAVIEGLRSLKGGRRLRVHLVSDSTYVIQGLMTWVRAWMANDWRRGRQPDSPPVKNVDLWRDLCALTGCHVMSYELVRGHAGHPENEECDGLAVRAMQTLIEKKSQAAGATRANIETRMGADGSAPAEPDVILHIHGVCQGNPGPGGWAVILEHVGSGETERLSGGDPSTTNNRMELAAAIEALRALGMDRRLHVRLVTNSTYVAGGLSEWVERWARCGWRRAQGADSAPVKNADLWRTLYAASRRHDVSCRPVVDEGDRAAQKECRRLATTASKMGIGDE